MEQHKAHFEPLSGVVRVGPGFEYGDIPEWSAAVRYVDPKTVEIMGVDKTVTVQIWRALKVLFASKGVKIIFYKRIKENEVRIKEVFL